MKRATLATIRFCSLVKFVGILGREELSDRTFIHPHNTFLPLLLLHLDLVTEGEEAIALLYNPLLFCKR
jgi:hypothetical protein